MDYHGHVGLWAIKATQWLENFKMNFQFENIATLCCKVSLIKGKCYEYI